MVQRVHKYRVPLTTERHVSIELPAGARLLHVGAGIDRETGAQAPFLWAQVDPVAPLETVGLWVAVTGAALPPDLGEHLGTAVLEDGEFVVHVFRRFA